MQYIHPMDSTFHIIKKNACPRSRASSRLVLSVTSLCLIAISGCASLLPKPAAQQTLFAIGIVDSAKASTAATTTAQSTAIRAQTNTNAPSLMPTLIVNAMRAAPGFDTAFIAYTRRNREIEYFTASRWVDTPAQMLTPLIARAIGRTGIFNAVVRAPTAASGELRLDTELIRLQQDFTQTPSRVRLTVHAVFIDTATRRVVGSRDFDSTVTAASENAEGGVVAADSAVKIVLTDLAAFCAEIAAR